MRYLILVVLLCTVSCGQPVSKELTQKLRMNIKGEPATLDPRKGGDVVSSTLHFMLFEGLTRIGENQEVQWAGASGCHISEDECGYTFYLKKSRWSDGSTITAHDYERAWKDVLNPSFPSSNAQLFYPIKNAEAVKKGLLSEECLGVTAIDDRTLFVELENPTPYFLQLIAFSAFFPINAEVDEKDSSWAYSAGDQFVCNGPFRLKKWHHNHQIIVEKNPYYWDAEAVRLDSIEISMIGNEMTVLHMYENGQFDLLASYLSPIPYDAMPHLIENGSLHICPTAGTLICAFNTDRFPFNNLKLRKAFSYAIDRDALIPHIAMMNELAATNAIPPILKNNESRSFFTPTKEEAQKLFKEAMVELEIKPSDLGELIYLYSSSSQLYHKIAQVIQQQWQEAFGIKVHLQQFDQKILFDKLSRKDFIFAQTYWFAQYFDPMNILERFKYKENVKNFANWQHPIYIELLDRSKREKGEVRLKTLEEAEALLMEEMPISPIYHCNSAILIKPYIRNVSLCKMGDVDFKKIYIEHISN